MVWKFLTVHRQARNSCCHVSSGSTFLSHRSVFAAAGFSVEVMVLPAAHIEGCREDHFLEVPIRGRAFRDEALRQNF